MSITDYLRHGTFGVELEVCACLFDMIDKYQQAKDYIAKQLAAGGEGAIQIPERITADLPEVALQEIQTAAQTRSPLYEMSRMLPYEAYFVSVNRCGESLGEKKMVPSEFIEEENDYTQWSMDRDGSIRCGFEEIQEKYITDAAGDEYDEVEWLREEAFEESGMIVAKADPTEYIEHQMALCLSEEHMLRIEVISRIYQFPKLNDFLTYVNTCIYNGNVIYELNTSQGLHISIGNSLVNGGGHNPRPWVENLVLLWWTYEADVLALVPKFRIDIDRNKYSAFARPLRTRFAEFDDLRAVEEGTGRPVWEVFYARQSDGISKGDNLFSGDEELDEVKYTTLNVKGIQIDPEDYEVTYTDKVFAEFRMLPASHNPDLMASWITLLSAFGALAMDDALAKAAIRRHSGRLPNIFGGAKPTVEKAIKNIKEANKAEILLTQGAAGL